MKTTAPTQQFMEWLYSDVVPLPVDPSFYTELTHALDGEDVKPQIFHLLSDSGRLGGTPPEFQSFLREHWVRVLCQNLVVKRATEDILRAFDEAGISAIWLKGTRFSERFFGHCGARSTSDIDILIPQSFANMAAVVLGKQGYDGPYRGMPDHFHEAFKKPTNDLNAPLVVELHHDLVRVGAAQLDLEELFEHATLLPGYRFALELSEQDTFYFMCIHAANHSLNHLKHRLDIVHLLYRKNSSVSLKQLVLKADRESTVNRVGMALSTVYHEFPFLNHVQPLPSEFVVARTRRNIRLYLVLDLLMLNGWDRRVRYLVNWFFPSKVTASISIGEGPVTRKTLIHIYLTLYLRRIKLTLERIWSAIHAQRVSH